MAILDQSYQPWAGERQPRYRRIGAMIRVEVRRAFAGMTTKAVILGTYAVMFAWMGVILAMSLVLRAPRASEVYSGYLGDLFPLGVLVMTLAALVGAPAIARDLRHNALAMYFSKAVTRADYLLGKFVTVAILLASATIVPAVCLWIGHWAVGRETLTSWQRLADLRGIAAHSAVLVVPMAMYVLALSSLSRNAFVPGALWVLTYLGSGAISAILYDALRQEWCKLLAWPNLVARLGELSYAPRPPRGSGTMAYGWPLPLAILAAVTVLSAAFALWRLRKCEERE